MDSLAFLERGGRGEPLPVYVLHGDEDFLKRRVVAALRLRILGEGSGEFSFSTHPGDKATFAGVVGELETLPFLSPYRLVVVENADPFVTKNRPALEKYVAAPAKCGVLVLDVRTWPSTTRLAKQVNDNATIVCKAPAAFKLPDWCVRYATAEHGKQLPLDAARLLVDLVGAEMGQLDQEISKLAVYVGDAGRITAQDVDQLVGSSRTANVFKIFDAVGEGRNAEAFNILERLFDQGEDPIRMLGAFSMQLRRLAQASRLVQRGVPFSAAAERVGIPPFAKQGSEQQLRRLGRPRAERLYDWLLEADLGMKGGSALEPRTVLERLLVKLAR
jgi:DNA polymerase-3 subunit delta